MNGEETSRKRRGAQSILTISFEVNILKSMEKNNTEKSAKALLNKTFKSSVWVDFCNIIREAWYLIRSSFKTVLPFLVIYSAINIIASWIGTTVFLRMAMGVFGTTYISPDNVIDFFSFPGTIAVTIVGFIFFALIQIVEIGGVMHAYSMSRIGKTAGVRGILESGLRHGFRSFKPNNWLVVPFILVLLPLTSFFPLSFSTFDAVVPGFIKEFLLANDVYRILYIIVYLILFLLEILWIFSMNFYILSDNSYFQAMKNSGKLIKGRYIFTVFCLFASSIIFSLAVTSISAALSSFVVELQSFFKMGIDAEVAEKMSDMILFTGGLMNRLLAPGFNIAILTSLFFHYVEDDNKLTELSRSSFKDSCLKNWQRLLLIALCAGLVITYFHFDSFTLSGGSELKRPEIVAHRGDSVNAPENTRPAFELALLEHTDWVELDVFMTKDGVIVISHDDDLSRTAGEKLFIHDLTYEEFSKLDVGKRFSDKFEGLEPSTLDEILKLFKGKMKVQIEIKYNDHMKGIEEKVLQIVNDNDMHDEVIITSLSDIPLKRMKELDPSIITTYSMYVAWADIDDIPFADYYTIEEANVEKGMADRIHAKGGKLFAWTVNSEKTVQYLVDCGVDGILTDNPNMLRNALDDASYSSGIPRLLRMYWNLLQDF